MSYREISYTLEEIATSYQGRDKEQMLFDFVKLSSGKHTDLVFRYAVERNDPGMAEALGHCLGCLDTGNWIPWIKELKPDALREALVRGYIRGLGSVSPMEIEEAIVMLGYDKKDPTLWRFALLELGLRNSALTEDFIFDLIAKFPGTNFSDHTGFRPALEHMIDNYDIQSLERMISQKQFKDFGENCSGVIGALLAEKDSDMAIRWSMSLNSLVARQNGVGSVLQTHLKNNRSDDEIVGVIDKVAGKNLPRANMITMVTAFKAQEDPLLAARFLESLSPNKINSRYYAYLAGQWYQQDGLAAFKWVSELPTGREKDTAIMILTSEIAAGDPATARTWAESISDEFLRAKALQAVETRQGK